MNTPMLLTVLLVTLSFIASASSLPANLQCPSPADLPHPYLAKLLENPNNFVGTSIVSGTLFVDTTGNFTLLPVGQLTGVYIQYYSHDLGALVAEFFVDNDVGQSLLVMNLTYTLLTADKSTRYNDYCVNFGPASSVPGYYSGSQLGSNFMSGTFLNQKKDRNMNPGGGEFGDVAESEYYFFDDSKDNSINCLTSFTSDATIRNMACYRFNRISSDILRPANSISKRDAGDVPTIMAGKLPVPETVIYPQYRSTYVSSFQ